MYINFWYPICTSAELGTDAPVRAQLLLSRLAAFRDANGDAHVLSDTCVHRGGSLSRGRRVGDTVQCPYHGWQFGGDGRCVNIPAMKAARPPARAKVDSYPVQERYGIVFAFLGDLPEPERPPFPEIPEFGQAGWRASGIEIIELNAFYERSMENGLDPAHNEFVHPLQGSPEFDPATTEYTEVPWGTRAHTAMARARRDKTELHSLRPVPEDVTADTWNQGPNLLVTRINLSKTNTLTQYFFEAPRDESHTRIFFINMRNCMLEPDRDAQITRVNLAVAGEDIAVLEELRPQQTPDTRTKELLGPGDESIVRFRKLLGEWRDRGWRIDLHAVRAKTANTAFAIPSPARRESGNWVLDTIPLVPGARHD